jgi:hypothetical protein
MLGINPRSITFLNVTEITSKISKEKPRLMAAQITKLKTWCSNNRARNASSLKENN